MTTQSGSETLERTQLVLVNKPKAELQAPPLRFTENHKE